MDVLDFVKTMPDCSVDLIVTDPPYRTISGGQHGHVSGILVKNDGKVFDYNTIQPEEWMPELYRVLKADRQCYIMTNLLNLERYLALARETGFKLHNLLIWEKNNVTPNGWYMKNCEYVLFLRKGRAVTINHVGSKTVHKFNNILGKNKRHPTEKPVDLMRFYIENSSAEGDIVFDPFMGSGTTGVAAKELNRDFIGCEIDTYYFNIACERIDITV